MGSVLGLAGGTLAGQEIPAPVDTSMVIETPVDSAAADTVVVPPSPAAGDSVVIREEAPGSSSAGTIPVVAVERDSAVASGGAEEPPPAVWDSTLGPLEVPAEPVGMWIRSGDATGRYAARTWADVAAALPLARVDRFGPPGFFETLRLDGVGSPVVIVDGIPWPGGAGGLPNVLSWPSAGIGAIDAKTPRLLAGLGVAAPDGAVRLESPPWTGGPPRSFVSAERGGGGWRSYGFGIERALTTRTALQLHGGFRKADQFEIDSYRAFGADARFQAVLRKGLVVRAGIRRYDGDEILFDPALQSPISHDASDERRVLFAEVLTPGMVGQAFTTQIHSAAWAREEGFADVDVTDARRGVRLSRRERVGPAYLTVTLRGERREATAESARREAGRGAAAAGVTFVPAPGLTARLTVLESFGEGERRRENGEAVLLWGGRTPGLVRVGRAWSPLSIRRWAEGDRNPGVVRYGETGLSFPFLPASPSVRIFRREGDNVERFSSIDAFRKASDRIDERVNGVEVTFRGAWGEFDAEASYLWSQAREKGESARPPYHSDHVARGRVSYAFPLPGLPAVPRWDALFEWRSDRNALESDVPMDGYYYLRGRVTIDLRGTDLFAQLEQVLGHRIEYLEGPVPGSDGVLSGTQQIYLGLYWPFTD